MTYLIALMVAAALGVANFAYQGLTDQLWSVAMERTWFQTTACLVMALVDYFIRRSAGAT